MSRTRTLIVRTPNIPFPEDGASLGPTSRGVFNFFLPLGSLYLATYARDVGGHEVAVLDLNMALREAARRGSGEDPRETVRQDLLRAIAEIRPQVVGVSAIFLTDAAWTFFSTEVVKAAAPDVTTVVGGSLPTIETARVLAVPSIDYAVVGEGEIAFRNFLDCWPDRAAIEGLRGLAFLREGAVQVNPREQLIADLDALPLPDLTLVPTHEYPRDTATHLTLFTSRGCPCHCTYCSSFELWTRKVRRHSVPRVMAEIRRLRDVYGVTWFDFVDDNFACDLKWLREFCAAMTKENRESGRPVRWGCPVGLMVRSLDGDIVGMMREAGCFQFSVAVESACARVSREILKKPINYDAVRRLRQRVKEADAVFFTFYMLGLPGETIPEMQQTVDFAREIESDWSVISIFIPYQGTELYRRSTEIGTVDSSAGHRNAPILTTKDFTKEDVKRIQYDANIETNFLRNRNVLRRDSGLQTKFHKEFMEHVVGGVPKHIIGKIVLGHVARLDGRTAESDAWWESARRDAEDPEVIREFGRYLAWDEEPLRAWKRFCGRD